MSTPPPLGWLSKSQAAELIGRSEDFVRRAVFPRMPPGTRRRARTRGAPWELSPRAVVQAYVEHVVETLAGDPAAFAGSDSPWLERQRRAKALMLERGLAEQERKLMSVELFQRVTEAAFIPLRRFAEEQIREHGNGTADAWADAVHQFKQEVERVIKPTNRDGAGAVSPTGEPIGSVPTDARLCGDKPGRTGQT